MATFKDITIIFLLAVVPLASAAPAKSASTLLQEGLYACDESGGSAVAVAFQDGVGVARKERLEDLLRKGGGAASEGGEHQGKRGPRFPGRRRRPGPRCQRSRW